MASLVKTKKYFISNLFFSKYCLMSLIFSSLVAYFLVPPKIWSSAWFFVGVIYILGFALSISCIIRIIKEKVLSLKTTGASIISIIAAVLGLGAMQVCGVGAPICGATIGFSVLAILAPGVSAAFLRDSAWLIITISIILQIASLFCMRCFKKI